MKEIPLTQGYEAIVDDDDYEDLVQFKWHIHKDQWNIYASHYLPSGRGQESMHRRILNAQRGQQVDHINHNGLDNRKENLRFCTNAQNQMNQKKHRNCGSKFRGIYWHKGDRAWRTHIKIEGKQRTIGHFKSELEAARAYDVKAKEAFGEFANLNFPNEP
jgi:hypothetical protein